jgi:hypothetical protein
MTGIFSLQQQRERHLWLPLAMVPLLTYTLWWAWTMFHNFGPLSNYVALSSVCDVQRGEEADTVAGMAAEGIASKNQTYVPCVEHQTDESGLNHRRYAVNDETLYVAPSDKRTDYSQPPMNSFYHGVLNTGRRRYAHPALSGSLPQPWLPAVDRPRAFGDGAKERRGVVLSLRRKKGKMLRRSQAELLDPVDDAEEGGEMPEGWSTGDILHDGSVMPIDAIGTPEDSESARQSTSNLSGMNPWGEPSPGPSKVFGQTPTPRKKVPGANEYDEVADEGNVWDDSPSEGEEAPSESPVSYVPLHLNK